MSQDDPEDRLNKKPQVREHGGAASIAASLLTESDRHALRDIRFVWAISISGLIFPVCFIGIDLLVSPRDWIVFTSFVNGVCIVVVGCISNLIASRMYDKRLAAIQGALGGRFVDQVLMDNRHLWPMRWFYTGILASLAGIGIFIVGASIHIYNSILGGSALLTLGLVMMACALVAAEQRDQEDAIDSQPHG